MLSASTLLIKRKHKICLKAVVTSLSLKSKSSSSVQTALLDLTLGGSSVNRFLAFRLYEAVMGVPNGVDPLACFVRAHFHTVLFCSKEYDHTSSFEEHFIKCLTCKPNGHRNFNTRVAVRKKLMS